MNLWYYSGLFAASLVLTAVYMFIWRKHDDVHITLIFTLIPIVNLGFLLLGQANTLALALVAVKITYLGGCFLQLIIVLAIFSLCRIRLHRLIRLFLFVLSLGVYITVLTIGNNDWFYADASLQQAGGSWLLTREYGPMHAVFYGVLITYFSAGIIAIIYALLRRNQVSRKLLFLLFMPQVVCIVCYFLGRQICPSLELLPAGYVFAQIVYLLIARRIQLYDVTDTVIDAMMESGETGFIIFDTRFHYLGSSGTARQILPELALLTVDLPLHRNQVAEKMLLPWLEQYRREPDRQEANEHIYEKDDKIYKFAVGPLAGRKSLHGYRIVITDDTLDRAYINLLDSYKQDLEREVQEKTDHIVKMHDNLIMSMAVMVESRDNSTGGHIRRTSDAVRMLIDIMRLPENAPEGYSLTKEFCDMMIKAAPMHDLGKIAVDDNILRKPGRFSPEEFEIMKSHASEGARIVHTILKDTDDQAFRQLAENVAHYHHERWDGSGYPERLKGTDIPPEARIMAVADVYDALVSKRVYKERMSFDKAHDIITEGMGTQFDPALLPVFLKAEPALRDYYTHVRESGEDEVGITPVTPQS